MGNFIRKTRIDELPQIYSVLTGTMSLIGPRPGLVSQAEAYDDVQRRRLLMRPGCTGLGSLTLLICRASLTKKRAQRNLPLPYAAEASPSSWC